MEYMSRACTKKIPSLLTSAAILLVPYAACAQTVDYGSLQSLFGEPVTTSATGTPQRVSDVPADMTIITADEIRQSGSRNIPQIIGIYVPGIDIFQTGLNSFDVGVRGYQQPFQPRLLVLIDGRQVFIDDYSRTIWDNLPVNIDNIRQIEVVKGAASALFGSNAAGGVVNIITYNPAYDRNNVVDIQLGTQNEINGDATASAKLGEGSGVTFSAGGMHADEFHTDANHTTDPNIPEPMHAYVRQRSVLQLANGLQADTEFTYAKSRQNPESPTLTSRIVEDTESWSAKMAFFWQTDLGLITSNNYYYHSWTQETATGTGYPDTTGLYVSQLQDQFKLGPDHTFRLAFEYRNKTFSNGGSPQSFPQDPSFTQNVYAPSGTWLWQINDRLSWTNAVRLDHQQGDENGTLFANSFYTKPNYSQIINALSANSGLVYKATDLDTFRATYGRGVQLPSFIEGNDNEVVPNPLGGAGFFVDLEGNPYLKPTIVENYALAYDRQLPSIYSTVRISPFYEMNRDLIAYEIDTSLTRGPIGGNFFTLARSLNEGESHGFGGEIELKGHSPDGFRWDASYSYSRVTDGVLALNSLDYAGSTPEHHFRLSGGYTTGPWEFDAFNQYVTHLDMQDPRGTQVGTGGYYSLSARIGYKLTDNVTLALSGTNLTTGVQSESPLPAVERQLLLTLTGHF